jgi:hypothetical protein
MRSGHAVHSDAPGEGAYERPPQLEHVDRPAVLLNLPAGHSVQVLDPWLLEKRPASHCVHGWPGRDVEPAAQPEHVLAPPLENLPAEHVKQLEEGGDVPYLPSTHPMHTLGLEML